MDTVEQRVATAGTDRVPAPVSPAPASPPGPLDALDPARLANLRDLGGLPVEGGGTTTFGVLYRADAPKYKDSPPLGVVAWPPRTVIDLRSAVERGRRPHPLTADETTVHHFPLLGDEIGPDTRSRARDALSGGLETLYAAILDFATPHLVGIANLLGEAQGPIMVHCAAGKDRTGMVVALFLSAVGVPHANVVADYSLTADNMPGVLHRLGNRSLLPGADKITPEMAATSVPAVEAVLRVLDGHPGGAHGWLVDAGADPAALAAWRERFVSTP